MTEPANRVEGILFDLDGTIIDTYDAILCAMRHTMHVFLGKEFSDEHLMRNVGQPLKTQMEEYARSEEECIEMLRVYRAYNAENHDRLVKYFEGTREVLESLKRAGYPMGIVTSKMHAPALHGLKIFNLEGYFSCLVGADDSVKHKPDPAPVIYGASLIDLAPEKCMFVGDSPFDIQAGNAAGSVSAAALWGMFREEELLSQNPSYSCGSLEEIAQILGVLS